MSTSELMCPKCLNANPEYRLFCCKCGTNLEPRTNLSLRLDEFQCSSDKDALGILESTGILAYLVDQFLVKPRERRQREWLSKHGFSTTRFKGFETLVEECAYTLSLEALPEVYVIESEMPANAFTFGNDTAPVIVVDSRLIQAMGSDELRSLLGHEMGHVKSRHMLYHSLANILAEGVGISTSLMGLQYISMAMKLALLAWSRESEFTADRASLISCGDPNQVASMFARLLNPRHRSISDSAWLPQDIATIFESHPNHLERIKAVFEFSKSADYAAIVEKIGKRRLFREAFIPKCRFCNASKPLEALFCPTCGKSQI